MSELRAALEAGASRPPWGEADESMLKLLDALDLAAEMAERWELWNEEIDAIHDAYRFARVRQHLDLATRHAVAAARRVANLPRRPDDDALLDDG